MSIEIPKIIHQIYESKAGNKPPELLLKISESWLEFNPEWTYKFWGTLEIDTFLEKHHPHFIDFYRSFNYDVQRWDVIRYLFLYHYGGVYVDFDYECLEPIDLILEGKTCCFGFEPTSHSQFVNKKHIISNAFISCIPQHPFLKCILEEITASTAIFSDYVNKFHFVMETTGPYMINRVFETYKSKENVSLLPSELICPLSKWEVDLVETGNATEEITEKIEK
ncbi:MAG: glycosyltransferase, partial [Prolixibacteraceae bacterium]|nr:glycosyltransferase [Prolixibacteraceae bacterium]